MDSVGVGTSSEGTSAKVTKSLREGMKPYLTEEDHTGAASLTPPEAARMAEANAGYWYFPWYCPMYSWYFHVESLLQLLFFSHSLFQYRSGSFPSSMPCRASPGRAATRAAASSCAVCVSLSLKSTPAKNRTPRS